MANGYNNQLAKQVGECLVCAELGRRGIIATAFSGNVPTFDVLAANQDCATLPIQVKASHAGKFPSNARNWMLLEFDTESRTQKYSGPTTLGNPDLIYVYVLIAPANGEDSFLFSHNLTFRVSTSRITFLGWSRRTGSGPVSRIHLIAAHPWMISRSLKITGR